MKPKRKRRWRLMEYRTFGGIDLMATGASVGAASLDWNEGRALTLRTRQTLRISVLKDERQASLIVGEVLAKVFD